MAIKRFVISHVGPLGDGVVNHNDQTIFIDRALPGEIVEAQVYQDRSETLRADITKIVKPSLDRQEPHCEHYSQCGNCSLQHANQSFYQNWKIQTVKDSLKKYLITPENWVPAFFVEPFKRRRLTFSALKSNGRITLGYYEKRTQHLFHIKNCEVTKKEIFDLKDKLLPFLKELIEEEDSLDIFIQEVEGKVEIVFTGQAPIEEYQDPAYFKKMADSLVVSQISWREDYQSQPHILIQKEKLKGKFGELLVNLPAGAFLQATSQGEKILSNFIEERLPEKGTYAELFSGCGTLTGAILKKGSVDCFEENPSAVKALATAKNKFPMQVFRRDLFESPLKREELQKYDALIFDPPRTGCIQQIKKISKTKIPLLISVSCNPATFARDASILCQNGYRLKDIQVVDQFLWSHHIEIASSFVRNE